MELTEKSINEFIDLVASGEPAPGGGAVSALMGAMGASLCMMVANLTLTRPKYEEHWSHVQQVQLDVQSIQSRLAAAVEKDCEAFLHVSEAYALPKETGEQIRLRTEKIQHGLLVATEVPFETLQLSFDALQLAKSLLGHSNPNTTSDLGVAALSLHTAMRGAWLNVLINISSIEDKDKVDEYRKKGELLVNEAQILTNEIYVSILAQM